MLAIWDRLMGYTPSDLSKKVMYVVYIYSGVNLLLLVNWSCLFDIILGKTNKQ